MSDNEVKAIRWVEHVLAPLMVIMIVTLATCSVQTQEAIAQLEATDVAETTQHVKTDRDISAIKRKQDVILDQQHNIEINVQRIETHQEHFKDELMDLNTQNAEIIRLLTTGHTGNSRQ
jgi:septal ring factor EnvC (AmiA/AmiB activator)